MTSNTSGAKIEVLPGGPDDGHQGRLIDSHRHRRGKQANIWTNLDPVRTMASRIEVTAVLNKVDSLASVAAKQRHLQKAIADLRSDKIPDDLQADQLRLLEARLKELGSV
jgi:ABC-type Zn2+ transport system substrate-binding protein/surface adhesin